MAGNADPSPLDARTRAVLDIPLHRFLGLRLADPHAPSAGVVLEAAGPALNQAGLLHGGVVTAVLDVASYLALAASLEPDEHAVTHDMAVQLLRPVQSGRQVHFVGEVLRAGRAVVFLRAEARVSAVVVATAQVTKTRVPAQARSCASGPLS